MPEIEFVDSEFDEGQDEDLVTGPRHAASRGLRSRTSIVVAALALAGAVLIGVVHYRAGTHDGGSGSGGGVSAAAATTPNADQVLAPEAPSGAFRVDHIGGDAPEGGRPGTLVGRAPTPAASPASVSPAYSSTLTVTITCPAVDACEASFVLPAAVFTALQARLPGVVRVTGSSVLVGGRHPTLRTRHVSAGDGRLDVRIDIAPATADSHPHANSATVRAGTTNSATAIEQGLAVTVTISGPDVAIPGLATVQALARDPRLLTVR